MKYLQSYESKKFLKWQEGDSVWALFDGDHCYKIIYPDPTYAGTHNPTWKGNKKPKKSDEVYGYRKPIEFGKMYTVKKVYPTLNLVELNELDYAWDVGNFTNDYDIIKRNIQQNNIKKFDL